MYLYLLSVVFSVIAPDSRSSKGISQLTLAL